MSPVGKQRPFFDLLVDWVKTNLLPPTTVKSESFPKWKSPSWDMGVRDGDKWLELKRTLDGAEGLWRVGDDLYDLTDFVDTHPGGRQWLQLTKGTDITELFESHHISDTPRLLLPKYFVKKSKAPRNSPFTFHPDGFYATLRNKVYAKIKHQQRGPKPKAKAYLDLMLGLTLATCAATSYYQSHWLAVLAGVFLNATTIGAHNFFHLRDNWRMYCFHISGLSVREWRVSHAMSHHMFPNCLHDVEVTMVEPWLQWLPTTKTNIVRFVPWIYSPIVYLFTIPGLQLYRWVATGHDGLLEALILVVPLAISMGGSASIVGVLYWWAVIYLVSSFLFGLVGINAGHHHHEVFHDGDEVKSNEAMDWGVFQSLAVRDKIEFKESLLSLSFFGDHRLHHMFPTLDHTMLPQLYPEFEETCKQFGIELTDCTFWECVKGQFLQLARVNKLSFSH